MTPRPSHPTEAGPWLTCHSARPANAHRCLCRRFALDDLLLFLKPEPMERYLNLTGRVLIAILFLGGFVQKIADPAPASQMIASLGLPGMLVWPVAAFNLIGGLCLIFGPWIRIWAAVLAIYCLATSWFHWQLGADPWQLSIMVKNWAIAGGLFILAAQVPSKIR